AWRGKRQAMTRSPPCTEFSPITKLAAWKGQRPEPDPEKGMELVREGIRLVKEIGPKYWLLENVYGSRKYISELLGPPRVELKPYALWGEFPSFMFDAEPGKKQKEKGTHATKAPSGKWVVTKGGNRVGLPEDFAFDPLRSWKRARIPIFLAQTMAKAMK